MAISEERLEAAAHAVGKELGYQFEGSILDAAGNGNQRAAYLRNIARAALSARASRRKT